MREGDAGGREESDEDEDEDEDEDGEERQDVPGGLRTDRT